MPKDDQSELFYLVDVGDNILGSVTRGEAHSDKTKIHRAVCVVLTNSKNQILLQKRSKHKDMYPGHWTVSSSGHVTFGESYAVAARREMLEEIGVKAAFEVFGKITTREENETEINTIFVGTTDAKEFKVDPTEVEKVEWISIEKLPEFMEKEPITPFARIILKHTGHLPDPDQQL